MSVSPYVREPKQVRSRRSFDRVVDAAVTLLAERGSDVFTLAEVAERAGVSIGSIYGRVDSKDDLLRAAHAREMARIDDATTAAFADDRPRDEPLRRGVDHVIRTTAELLRGNAAVMAPFMLVAHRDPVVAEAGRAAHGRLVEAFGAALLAHRDAIRHPDPERAVRWSCTVVYSVLARWLGLGSDPQAAGEGDWEQIVADLTDMITAFLGGSWAGAAGRSAVHAEPWKSSESEP